VIVHFVDIGGIVGHLNLRVLFKAIQQLSIDKYNLSLEKGTNIKKQHHHTNNKCMSSKETKQIELKRTRKLRCPTIPPISTK
jgi:hypothetical protein